MNDENLIQEYITTRGLKQNTYHTIKSVLNHYSNYQQLTLQELIQEAEQEEEQQIRWKHRRLKKRLTNYNNHLRQQMKINSAKSYLTIVKSFYYHHEIEIHQLPPINKKNANANQVITYNDLPNHEVIKRAVDIADPLMRSLMLFLSSSGMSKVDCLKLSIQDFITATTQNHTGGNLKQIIQELENQDVIPVWRNRRTKTNKYFVTFNTPEATNEICKYLTIRMEKQDLKLNDKLFKIDSDWYTVKFQNLNDALGLGTVGSYIRLRGHMLRKFHATQLEKAGMPRTEINVLQGKSNGAVDDVYFYFDEKELLNHYQMFMHKLFIITQVKEVDIKSPEFQLLQSENLKLKNKFAELEQQIQDLRNWWI